MHTVQSTDGTTIAHQRTGTGPAVVLVTGAFCDHASAAGLVSELSAQFTVITYDRRGRGESGDAATYTTDREVEDLAAVLGVAGGPAHVYGHSSGARLALDAAAAGLPIRRLAVYEPPFRTHPAPTWQARVQHLLDLGDRRGAAVLHLRESGTPEHVLTAVQQAPWWPAMEALAHTLPYDEALCGDLSVPTGSLSRVTAPTLVLGGSASDADLLTALQSVAAAIPTGRFDVLPGHGHVPPDGAVAPLLAAHFGR
jgi:pimeloyl-ACP methyl ester carboxylesterase